jgi:phospholipid/cholesterol/gamma-HCH transport system substrate-binding protein
METRASHVLIGAFTLAVIGLAVAFVLWIAKSSLDREFDEYDIVFREAVTGLTVSGSVQYNGIQIGEVRKLALDPADPSRVIAHVRVAAGTPVRSDTRATLAYMGLTGVVVIQLTGGRPDSPPLEPKPGEAYGTIVADVSSLGRLMDSGGDMMANINELVGRVTALVSDENIAKVTSTLEHLEALSGEVAGRSGELGTALKQTLERADRLLADLDGASDTARGLLDHETRAALVEMRESLATVRRFADSADRILAANDAALANLGSQGLSQVGPLIAELRTTLQRLEAVAGQVERDPARFLLGRDQPREKALE